MARDIPTGFGTAAEAKEFPPVFLVELDWPDGTVYCWNGYGSISWDGQTWVGTGHLGTISDISESIEGVANGCMLTLSGIPSELVIEALSNDAMGRPAKIYLTALTAAGAFAVDPLCIFDGVIDVTPYTDDGKTATISVQLEKELIDRRIKERRYTHEDQQIDYPGDMFFSFVAGLGDKSVSWGGKTVGGSPTAPGASAPGATNPAHLSGGDAGVIISGGGELLA